MASRAASEESYWFTKAFPWSRLRLGMKDKQIR
jgi:hypothetical protein